VSTEVLAFIAKPFTPAALAARVRAVLDADPGAMGSGGEAARDQLTMANAEI
jgi:DNA-binding response OmpR family regulator